jgi:hypothetical protein
LGTEDEDENDDEDEGEAELRSEAGSRRRARSDAPYPSRLLRRGRKGSWRCRGLVGALVVVQTAHPQ